MINLRIIYGIIKHDLLAYVNAYHTACEWSKNHPEIDPSNFDALQDKAWEDLEETIKKEGEGIFLTHIPKENAN